MNLTSWTVPYFNGDVMAMGPFLFLISWLTTQAMIRVGITDIPKDRSSHTIPTPRSGGIGFIVAFFCGMGYLYLSHHIGYIRGPRLGLLSAAALLTIVVSFRDDLRGLSFVQKLAAQVLAAICVVGAGLYIQHIPLPFFGVVEMGILGMVGSFLWILFFINAFNFMDGLNGHAAGVSLVASLSAFIIGILLEERALTYISFSLFWSILGFFILNFPKGRIFMGDVGSQFLGLIWAIVLLIPAQESHTDSLLSIYTVPILFFNFIYDVVMTVGRRMLGGEPFWLAHRTHLFHLMNRVGYSHKQVTCFHMTIAVLQGAGAVAVQYIPSTCQILIFIPYAMMMIVYHFWIYSHIQRKTLKKRSGQRGRS